MARKRKKGNPVAVIENSYDLTEVELSPADKALLSEISLNRRAILKIAQISLDHECRIAGLEEALADLAGEAEVEAIDIEKAEGDEDEEE